MLNKESNVDKKPYKLIMMVGLPGVGKSTYMDQVWMQNELRSTLISTDLIFELICKEYGYTYNELFNPLVYAFAERMMYHLARKEIERKTPTIIWDQTNLTVKSRKRKLALFDEKYNKVAIYLKEPADHGSRLAKRPGKIIPSKVIDSMRRSFEMPTLEEGFDIIHIVDNNEHISHAG